MTRAGVVSDSSSIGGSSTRAAKGTIESKEAAVGAIVERRKHSAWMVLWSGWSWQELLVVLLVEEHAVAIERAANARPFG